MASPYLAASPAVLGSLPSALSPSSAAFRRASVSSGGTTPGPDPLAASDGAEPSLFPVLSPQTKPLIHTLALPDASSAAAPGWSVRWSRYTLNQPSAAPAPTGLVLPAAPSLPAHRDRPPTAHPSFSSVMEWLDSLPPVLTDPFEQAVQSLQSSTPGWLPSKLCYIQNEETEHHLQRTLYVFDLDATGVPHTIGPLSQAETGSFSYGSLFPALVDARTGHPQKFTAKNAPSALDLKMQDPHGACAIFSRAVQHHIIQDLSSKDPHKWVPLSYHSALYASFLAVTIRVAFKWEGLLVTPCHEISRLRPVDDLAEGDSLRLVPLHLSATFIRPFGRESEWTQRQKYSKAAKKSAKISMDVLAERTLVDQELRPAFQKLLGVPLDSQEWYLCLWDGREVAWPAPLCLVDSTATSKTRDQPPQPPSLVLQDLAIKTGQYIDDLVKERDRLKAEGAPSPQPQPVTQPAPPTMTYHHYFDVFTPQSLQDGASPMDILSELKAAAQPPAAVYPTPPDNSVDGQAAKPQVRASWTDADLFHDDKDEHWDRYDRYQDTHMNEFDLFGGGGITEDDFSFYDDPSPAAKSVPVPPSLPSANPFTADLFGASPSVHHSPASFASPGTFGDLPSPPKPLVPLDHPTPAAASTVQSSFGASPATFNTPAAVAWSPSKSGNTPYPFTPQDQLAPIAETPANRPSTPPPASKPALDTSFAAIDVSKFESVRHGAHLALDGLKASPSRHKREPSSLVELSLNNQWPAPTVHFHPLVPEGKPSKRPRIHRPLTPRDDSDSESDSAPKESDDLTEGAVETPVERKRISHELLLTRFQCDQPQVGIAQNIDPSAEKKIPTVPLPGEALALVPIRRPSVRLLRSNSVVSMDIAACHEILKLGLQPLSGPKDITVCFVCEPSEQEQAVPLVSAFCYVYQVGGYGSAKLAKGPGPTKGVCSVEQVSMLPSGMLTVLLAHRKSTEKCQKFGIASRCIWMTAADFRIRVPDLLTVCIQAYGRPLTTQQATTGLPTPPASPRADGTTTPTALPTNNSMRRAPPAFVLEPGYRKERPVQFALEWPPTSYDILDRHRLLHISYTPLTSKQVYVQAIDDAAEGHSHAVLETRSADVVATVWKFIGQQIKRTSIEWRIVIEMLFVPSEEDIAEWSRLLSTSLKKLNIALHVSICHISQQHWGPLCSYHAPAPRAVLEEGQSVGENPVLFDQRTSTIAHAVYHSSVLPCYTLQSVATSSVYISTYDELHSSKPTAQYPAFHVHLLHVASTQSSLLSISLHRYMQDLTSNLVDLYHYGHFRSPELSQSKLPYHLARLYSTTPARMALQQQQKEAK